MLKRHRLSVITETVDFLNKYFSICSMLIGQLIETLNNWVFKKYIIFTSFDSFAGERVHGAPHSQSRSASHLIYFNYSDVS